MVVRNLRCTAALQLRFAQIHASMPSNDFAHNSCGFLLWHRKFLLVYGNMLRGHRNACREVTLSYWNYFEDHDNQLSVLTPCKSMLECSEFLQDFDGVSSSAKQATQSPSPNRGLDCAWQTE